MPASSKSFTALVRQEIANDKTEIDPNRAFVRACFLAGGAISNPDRSYHLDFVLSDADMQKLTRTLRGFGIDAKVTQRRGLSIVYIKEASEIADILNLMLTHKSLLRFENIRVEKDLRNNLNRKVNFETANLNKTVAAALEQIQAIEFIEQHVGLEQLAEPLEKIARLRLKYDAASMEEIGAMLTPPIGKSGVNHRLRKICEIANTIKGEIQID
ncbi:MAG: DNA-binding protein WhiA [Defluviitaleaceae bacterium]|nr:DNA-binding protein WhiA [Defluviitaleaceae bacterium]